MGRRWDRGGRIAPALGIAVMVGLGLAVAGGAAFAQSGNLPRPAGSVLQRGATPPAAPAPAPTPTPTTAPAAAPADLDAARLAWDGRPQAERETIQTGLVWTGDYTGAVDGTFGRMTFEAIRAFQTRHGFAADGVPTAAALDLLGKTATEKRAAVGFALVDDPRTGVRLGLPTKLLGKSAAAEGGSRWTSKDGRIDYRTYAVAKQDLAVLFDRLKKPGPGHEVGYAVLRADWFVIADTVGKKRGYQRFEKVGEGVRGFIVYSDPAVGPSFDRVVIASAATFEATPGAKPAAETLPAPKPATTPPPAAVATPAKPAPATGVAATGLLVAPGRAVVVAAVVDGCRALTVSGRPATMAGLDDAKTLALLSWADTATVPPIRLAAAAPKPGNPMIVVSRAADGRAVASGSATEGGGVRAALQRGGFSAPVLDAAGGLVGLVAAAPDETRAFAGVLPAATYPVVPGSALATFVGKAGGGIEPADPTDAPLTSAAAVARLGDRLVPVLCEK